MEAMVTTKKINRNKILEKRYTPVKELGSGAFATVFLAHDNKLDREVAIKIFHGLKGGNSLARFEREIKICRGLSHPNIVEIYDATSTGKSPNIIMNYIDSGDLEQLLKKRHLTVEESLIIGIQVGKALIYLHNRGIIHRDIKPANIMISKPFAPILMDFNLAYNSEFTMLTEEGFTVGTPRFMAPELFIGATASERSDVFSLGLILYEILSRGKISQSSVTVETIMKRSIQPLSSFNSTIPVELVDLVHYAIENNPQERCASATELVDILEQISCDRKDKNPATQTGRLEKIPTDPIVPTNPRTQREDPKRTSVPDHSVRKKIKRVKTVRTYIIVSLMALFLIFGIDFAATYLKQQRIPQTIENIHVSSHPTISDNGKIHVPATVKNVPVTQKSLRRVQEEHESFVQKVIENVSLKEQIREIAIAELKKFHDLHISTRRSPEGRKYLLSIALVVQCASPDYFPAESSLLKILPRLRGNPSEELKTALAPYLRSEDMSEKSYNSLKNTTTTLNGVLKRDERLLFPFLTKIRVTKNKLNIGPPRRDFLGFLAPTWKNQENVGAELSALIGEYVKYIHLASILMELKDKNDLSALFIIEAVRDCLIYSWYGFHHLMARQFAKMGDLNPSSSKFTRENSFLWKKAAMEKIRTGNLTKLGYSVCKFNELMKDIASLSDKELKDGFFVFAKEAGTFSRCTGTAMVILGETTLGNKGPTKLETGQCFDELLSMPQEEVQNNYEGWCALTCIVSNKVFLNLKETGNNEERKSLTVTLLKRLSELERDVTENTDIESIFIRKYSNSTCLKICTIIHACDSYAESGQDFFKLNEPLCQKLGARKLIEETSKAVEQNDAKGGGLAAVKILRGEPLEKEDLLINPLRYN